MNDRFGQEKRSFQRAKCVRPVQFQLKDPRFYGGCQSQDLSEGGVQIDLNDFLPLNTEIIVQLQLASEKIVDCVGRIVWVQKMPFTDRYRAGLRFDETNSLLGSRRNIQRYVDNYTQTN